MHMRSEHHYLSRNSSQVLHIILLRHIVLQIAIILILSYVVGRFRQNEFHIKAQILSGATYVHLHKILEVSPMYGAQSFHVVWRPS